jgi:hypothetical protein
LFLDAVFVVVHDDEKAWKPTSSQKKTQNLTRLSAVTHSLYRIRTTATITIFDRWKITRK